MVRFIYTKIIEAVAIVGYRLSEPAARAAQHAINLPRILGAAS